MKAKTPDKHPRDAVFQGFSQVEATERFEKWLSFPANFKALKACILTYADGDAQQIFEYVREYFWIEADISL